MSSVLIFATADLAGRVLAEGCTGVQFEHPLWFRAAHRNYVIRTVDGMGHIQQDAAGQSFKVPPISVAEADARPRLDERFEFQRESGGLLVAKARIVEVMHDGRPDETAFARPADTPHVVGTYRHP